MKKFSLVLISIALLIVDNTFSHFISIKGIAPSFLFTFAIAYSIVNGKEEGIKIGVLSGILQDIFFYNVFGVNSLLNMLTCFIAGIIGEGIFRNKKLVPTIAIYFTTVLKYVGAFMILRVLNIKIEFLNSIYVALYNAVLMILLYKLVYKYSNIEAKNKQWRFK